MPTLARGGGAGAASAAPQILKEHMTYNRYPLSMHKGQWPNIQSEYVYDEAGEKALADKGYGIKAPWVPDVPEAPAVEPKPSELAERISALESQISELKAAVDSLTAKKGKK